MFSSYFKCITLWKKKRKKKNSLLWVKYEPMWTSCYWFCVKCFTPKHFSFGSFHQSKLQQNGRLLVVSHLFPWPVIDCWVPNLSELCSNTEKNIRRKRFLVLLCIFPLISCLSAFMSISAVFLTHQNLCYEIVFPLGP